jgi:4-diphosphocytidyl-2-C-methyl-D-erythritol kinase
MIFLAPAKVNMTLAITGRDKKDGYHFINSIFDPIALYDILDIIQVDGTAIQVKDALSRLNIPQDRNLAYRAAAALQAFMKVKRGALITLYKHIPDGAGLGGGSSDAAAVLKALNRIWGINLPEKRLMKTAFKLGSDVPFFLNCSPAIVSGKGEKTCFFKREKKFWYVIVALKGVKVLTSEAYNWYDRDLRLTSAGNNTILIPRLKRDAQTSPHNIYLFNDFEIPVYRRNPALEKVRDALLCCGKPAGVQLSGSGSAVFALFETKSKAYDCYKKAGRLFKGSFVCLTHSV